MQNNYLGSEFGAIQAKTQSLEDEVKEIEEKNIKNISDSDLNR